MFTPKQDALKAEVRRLMDIYPWTQGTLARTATGEPTGMHISDPNPNPKYAPCQFCAIGFMQFAKYNLETLQGKSDMGGAYDKLNEKIYRKLNENITNPVAKIGIAEFNDTPGRTKEEVRALFE